MRWLALLLPASLATLACEVQPTSTSGFPANGAALVVTGAVPLGADQAAAVAGTAACTPAGAASSALAWTEVIATDQPAVCDLLQAGEEEAWRATIRLLVARPGATGSALSLVTGSYPVSAEPGDGTGPWAMLSVVASDGQCNLEAIPAADGVVSLTAVDAGHLQGTVVADLAGGGRVLGSFGVDLCAASLAGDACAGPPALAGPACVH